MAKRSKNLIKNLKSSRTGQKRDGTTAFFIETLMLFTVFTVVTVVLMKGFSFAGKLSRDAESLSKAAHLAEAAAEMVSASESGETLLSLLNENGNASVLEQAADASYSVYRAKYDADMRPSADGIFYADVSWKPGQDGLVRSTVNIYRSGETEALYSLDLAVYINVND